MGKALKDKKLGFIGSGIMAEAIVTAVRPRINMLRDILFFREILIDFRAETVSSDTF